MFRRTLYVIAGLLIAVVALAIMAIIALQDPATQTRLVTLIARLVSREGERTVEIRGLTGTVPTNFNIAELTIADPEGTWLRVTGIQARGAPYDLVHGRIHLARVSAATAELARLPHEGADDEPFNPPRLLRSLVVDALHVDGVRIGREVFTPAAPGERSVGGETQWSTPVRAEGAGTYWFHGETIDARIAMSADNSSGLLPTSVDGRARGLELTATVVGHVFRPTGVLTLKTRAAAYGEQLSADALEVDVHGQPERGDEDGPYEMTLTGILHDPRVSNALDPVLGSEAHVAAQARFDADAEHIDITSLVVDSVALEAQAAGRLENGKRIVLPKVTVAVRDLARLGGEGDKPFAGGQATIEGELHADVDAGTAGGKVTATAADVSMAAERWRAVVGTEPVLSANFTFEREAHVLHISDVHLTTAHADARGAATLEGSPMVLDGDVTATVDELEGVALPVALTGEARIDARLHGPLDALAIQASGSSERLRVATGPVFSASVSLQAEDITDRPAGLVRAQLRSSFGDIAAGSDFSLVPGQTLALSSTSVESSGARLEGQVSVDLPNDVAEGGFTGKFSDLSSLSPVLGRRVAGKGDLDAKLRAEGGAQALDASLRLANVSYGGLSGMNVKKLALEASLRDVLEQAGGEVRLDASNLSMRDVSVSTLRANAKAAHGTWGVEANARGHYLRPFRLQTAGIVQRTDDGFTARVRLLEGSLGERPLQLRRELVVAKTADLFSVDPIALSLGEARASGACHVRKGALDGVFEVDTFPLDLLQLYNPTIDLRGSARGRVDVGGTKDQPDLKFALEADGVQVGATRHDALPPVDVQCKGRYDGQGFAADATLSGASATRFDLHAAIPPGDAPASLDLDGTADVALLSGLGVLGEDRIGGTMRTKLTLGGTAALPQIAGTLTLDGGFYENAAIGAVIDDVSLRVIGEGTRLTLERFDATDGKDGHVRASGGVDFASGLRNASYGVDVTLEGARVARRDELSGKASGQLRVAGSGAAPMVAGKIEVARADVRIPERLPADVVDLEVQETNVEAKREDRYGKPEPPDTIPAQLDVQAHMPGRIFVRGSEIDTEWEGDVHVTGSAKKPVLDGKLSLVRGTFRLLNVRLKAVEGTVEFDGGEKINPILNIVGEAKKHDVLARVNISGRATKPEIHFSSEPPLPEDEVIAHLLFGKSPSQLSAVESVQLAAAVARMSGGGGMGPDPLGWLQRTFKLDTVDVTSAETAEGGSMLSVGKYLREGVFVSVNQGLTENTSTASVEVELKDNLTLQSKVGRDAEGSLGINWKWDY